MVHCNHVALKGLAKETQLIGYLLKLVAMESFVFPDKIKMKLKNIMNIFLALTIEQV